MSEEVLQTAEKREVKGKGERESHTQPNADSREQQGESEQCKEIKENKTTEKTRDLFKKTGDTKGAFHARMGK